MNVNTLKSTMAGNPPAIVMNKYQGLHKSPNTESVHKRESPQCQLQLARLLPIQINNLIHIKRFSIAGFERTLILQNIRQLLHPG